MSLTVNGDVCFANYGSQGNPHANDGFSGLEIVGMDKVPARRGISVEEDPFGDLSFFISGFQGGQQGNPSAFRFKNGILPGGAQAPNANSASDVMAINNIGQLTLTNYGAVLSDAFVIQDAAQTINFKVKKNGTVYSREIYVQTGAFPDYVFAKEYKLLELNKLKQFINENKHLPNMPTASEVKENGMNLGELSRLQTEKIEELTLYVIQLKEEIEAIKKQTLKNK